MARAKAHPTPGARPGTLTPPAKAHATEIHVVDFDPDRIERIDVQGVRDLLAYRESASVTWIDVVGLRDVQVLEEVGEAFSIHPLALEDAVNVPVRPKTELHSECHLIVLQLLKPGRRGGIDRTQVTIYVGNNFLLTVREKPWDIFEPIHRRLDSGKRIRHNGPDYLAYTLIDLIVDSYFPLTEWLTDQVEKLEEEIIQSVGSGQVSRAMRLRKRIQMVRRTIWPTRELLRALQREESPFVSPETLVFLRDCSDHCDQLHDLMEHLVESTTQLTNLHSAQMSNMLNETMKTLTIMSTIFIPLGFLAGVYGMNFEFMPELHWRWSYPVVLGVMGSAAGGLLMYFRRRGWIGRK